MSKKTSKNQRFLVHRKFDEFSREYKKGVESIKQQIHIHRNVKLEKALEKGNVELASYYEKEIKRLDEQLREKETKLLPKSKRMKLRK